MAKQKPAPAESIESTESASVQLAERNGGDPNAVVETFTVSGGGYHDQVPGLMLGVGEHTFERLASGRLRLDLGGVYLTQQDDGSWTANLPAEEEPAAPASEDDPSEPTAE